MIGIVGIFYTQKHRIFASGRPLPLRRLISAIFRRAKGVGRAYSCILQEIARRCRELRRRDHPTDSVQIEAIEALAASVAQPHGGAALLLDQGKATAFPLHVKVNDLGVPLQFLLLPVLVAGAPATDCRIFLHQIVESPVRQPLILSEILPFFA